MDSRQLKQELEGFLKECTKRGFPITYIGFKEAYPTVEDTSYFVEIQAPWTYNISYSEALDQLFDILWDTTSEVTRQYVFAIKILESESEVRGSESIGVAA